MDQNDTRRTGQDTEDDLRARLTVSQLTVQVLFQGFHALRSHGVDFMKLREWKENTILEEAWKLKPTAAREHITAYLDRLSHAIKAAINRKTNVKLVTDNSDIYTE